MKALILALLLSGHAFGKGLSKDAIDAYATSISDIFDHESQEDVESKIEIPLSKINPDHAKDTVKAVKAIVREYSKDNGPMDSSFVAGVIAGTDAVNTQTHDIDPALTSAVSTPSDAQTTPDDTETTPDDTVSAPSETASTPFAADPSVAAPPAVDPNAPVPTAPPAQVDANGQAVVPNAPAAPHAQVDVTNGQAVVPNALAAPPAQVDATNGQSVIPAAPPTQVNATNGQSVVPNAPAAPPVPAPQPA